MKSEALMYGSTPEESLVQQCISHLIMGKTTRSASQFRAVGNADPSSGLGSMAIGWLRNWKRGRLLKKGLADPDLWEDLSQNLTCLDRLNPATLDQLHHHVTILLSEKRIDGVASFQPDEYMRMTVGALVCLPLLQLSIEKIETMTGILLYPEEDAELLQDMSIIDAANIRRESREFRTTPGGPMILSWEEVAVSGLGIGYNAVVHEVAHMLDMETGTVNGRPVLPKQVSASRWTYVMGEAYSDHIDRISQGTATPFPPCAAENPAEFFAVMSEFFFDQPWVLQKQYSHVFSLLAQYYGYVPLASFPI